MNDRQKAFFSWMCGGFLLSITIVFLIAGVLPADYGEESLELLAVYMIPIVVMYVLVRLNPKLIDRIFESRQ